MARKSFLLLVFPGIISLSFLVCRPSVQETPAHTISVIGNVTIQRNNAPIPAAVGTIVNQNDTITTGDRSMAIIQISNKLVIHIRSNSKVTVKELVENSTSLLLDKGVLISKVKPLLKGQQYMIKMPTATASVRGTEFLAKADEKGDRVAIHSGIVMVKPSVVDSKGQEQPVTETAVEGGKVAIVSYEKDTAKAPLTIEPISARDRMILETAAKIDVVPQEALEKPAELEKRQQEIRKVVERINDIDELSEEQLKYQIKKEKIEKLLQKQTRTLEEIKEACERIDVVRLYSGKQIQGAIMERGDSYKILTTTGVINVPRKDVRAVSVIR